MTIRHNSLSSKSRALTIVRDPRDATSAHGSARGPRCDRIRDANGAPDRKEDALEEETLPSRRSHRQPRHRAQGRAGAWLEPVLYALLALALNLAGNERTGLWDRDEPRYAVCVREMRARGDWIFPTFNGEPRYHKPILIYWLMGLGTALGGDNPFGARLVSAVAGAATVLGVTRAGPADVRARRAGWPA